jgi:hypothetical protein
MVGSRIRLGGAKRYGSDGLATSQRGFRQQFGIGAYHLGSDLEHDGGLLALDRGAVAFTVSDGLGSDKVSEDQCCRQC